MPDTAILPLAGIYAVQKVGVENVSWRDVGCGVDVENRYIEARPPGKIDPRELVDSDLAVRSV